MIGEVIAWCLVLGIGIMVIATVVVFLSIFVSSILMLFGKGAREQGVADTDEREAWLQSEDSEDELDEAMGEPVDLLEEED